MKRINPYLLTVLLFACLAFRFSTISWTTITQADFDIAMNKMTQFYKTNTHYTVHVTHASYQGHDAEVPYQTSTGFYTCDKNQYHSFLLGIRTIQNEKIKIVIDSIHKTITVADIEDNDADDEIRRINYDNSHHYITAYKSAIIDKENLYRLEFNEATAYSSYNIDLNDEGCLHEMTIFYKNEYPTDPSNPSSPKVKAKLKISYSEFDSKTAFDPAKIFSTAKYITESSGKLTLTKAYRGYRLFDIRISKKN